MNTLFEMPPKPQSKRRVMMHVIDAGDGDGEDLVRLKCKKCGHDTDWIPASKPWSLDKRGRPCPKCNAAE